MKKLLAIALASVMAFSTPLTVSAEEIVVSDGTFETEYDAEEESGNAGAEDVTGASLGKEDFDSGAFDGDAVDVEDRYQVDFEISSAMMAEKNQLYSVLEDLKSVTPGKDYIDGQLIVKAESQSMAQRIADGFEGTLQSCQNGIAVFNTELSTVEAVTLAADRNMRLPAVYPNYIYTTDDFEYEPVNMDGLTEISPDISAKIKELQEAVKPKVPEEAFADTSMDEANTGSSVSQNVTDPDIELQWYHKMIDTFAAWEAAPKMGEGITVAVIDSGIDDTHPEFAGRVAVATPLNGIVTPVNGSFDNTGHGTHVAGIIGAAVNNGIGGAGIAPKANILSIKALDVELDEEGQPVGDATGSTLTIAVAMETAMQNQNVRVINMSLGGPTGISDQFLQEEVDEAIDNGIVVVAASGNEGWDISQNEYKSSPACLDGVVSVASLDINGALSNFSNYGDIDISAPGGTAARVVDGVLYADDWDIYSTFPCKPNYPDMFGKGYKEGYTYMAGTSQACPVVSGVIALMLSNDPKYEKNEKGVESVVSDLKNAAVNIGKEKTYGAGRINAAAAVGAGSVYTKDNNYDVVAGKKLTLAAKMGMENAKPVWDVSNKDVCTITQKGVLKAAKTVSANTSVTVTATANGKSASATVTIWPKAATITRVTTAKSAKLKYLQTQEFTVTASCDNIPAPVVYKSSNNKVAAVDQKGMISALANGKATITATTVGGKKATFKVTVTDTPYIIERIVPANKRDQQGAQMFAQSYYGVEWGFFEATPVSEGKSVKYKAIAVYPYNTASSKDKKMEWECETVGLRTGKSVDKITFNKGVLKVGKGLSEPVLIAVAGWPQDEKNNICTNAAIAFKPINGYHFGTEKTVTKPKSSTSVSIQKGGTELVKFGYLTAMNADISAINPFPYVESSDDEIAVGFYDTDAEAIKVIGYNTGKCKITLTSTDGAYKKATINVTVK